MDSNKNKADKSKEQDDPAAKIFSTQIIGNNSIHYMVNLWIRYIMQDI